MDTAITPQEYAQLKAWADDPDRGDPREVFEDGPLQDAARAVWRTLSSKQGTDPGHEPFGLWFDEVNWWKETHHWGGVERNCLSCKWSGQRWSSAPRFCHHPTLPASVLDRLLDVSDGLVCDLWEAYPEAPNA